MLVAIAVGLLAFAPQTAAAQAAPTITAGAAENRFPDGVAFSATTSAPEAITDVRLRYEILPDGTSASARPEFERGATTATVQVTLDDYLAPGTIIKYHWEVRAGDETAATEEQSFFYDDIRFQWDKVDASGLTVYHYTGDEEIAQSLHDVGMEALADAEELLNVQVPFPVNVWIYETREDMVPALPPRSPTFEEQIITLGVRIASDTVLVLGGVSYDTLVHELTHVVTAVAGDSAFGSMPAWLDEGTAVYAQGDKGGYEDAVESALRRGNVLSLSEITTAPGEPEKVGLFYGQSWSIVQFLVDTYGEEEFAQLFAEVKAGELMDDALMTVYGFDQLGLENAWRESHDLPTREAQEPTEPGQRTGAPQITQDDDGASSGILIAIGAAVLLLAGAVAVAGIVVARRLG